MEVSFLFAQYEQISFSTPFSLSRFLWYMFCALFPCPPFLFLRLTTHTHIVARVIVPSYQAHARVKTQRHCQHTSYKQTSRLLSGIIPTYHPHKRVYYHKCLQRQGFCTQTYHSFPLTYLRAYLIPGVSCHHIHA